jgi:hypothetical protein
MFGKRRKKNAGAGSSVPPTWLAWPTLRNGGGQIRTAGVSHHPDAVRKILNANGPLVMAELRIETTGQYAGAVRVFVAGEMLGSIPHDLAETFREVVSDLWSRDMVATCRAELEADEWSNVWLDARPEPRPKDDPFLPPFSPFQVNLGPGEAERLDEGLQSRAKNKRVVTVGRLAPKPGKWQLVLDDTPVGVIEDRLWAVESAIVAGMPLSCQVRILREEGKGLRVMADLPRSDEYRGSAVEGRNGR